MAEPETFMDLCCRGVVREPDATIEDWVAWWHDGAGEGLTLDEYLGMSGAEYRAWAELRKTVQDIVWDRGEGMIGDGPWDGVDPVIRESRRWLEGRLPDGLEPTGEGYCCVLDMPLLCFTNWSRPHGGGLVLRFATPHVVGYERFWQGRQDRLGGTLNLAFDLDEIIDLIRTTLETDRDKRKA